MKWASKLRSRRAGWAARGWLLSVLLLFGVGTQAQSPSPPVQGGLIHGHVKSRNMALPGVTVSAVNTLTGQKATTSTDVDGSFILQVPADGRYVIRTQMVAFAPLTREVVINNNSRAVTADLELVLLSRVPKTSPEQTQEEMAARAGGGLQNLSLTQSEGGDEATGNGDASGMTMPGIPTNTATESVAISGATSNPMGAMGSDEFRERINEAREMGGMGGPGMLGGRGGFGGFGGSPGGFGGPVRVIMRGRRFDINRPHGTVYYTVGDSALDAAPYSLTGQPVTKPGYLQNRFGFALGGPLNIPKIYNGGSKTFFFVNYNGSRGENPFDAFSTVPTLQERSGDFSQAGLPAIYDPASCATPGGCTQFTYNGATNVIPPGRLDSAAQKLLDYIPLPNLPGTQKNFHRVASVTNNSDNLNVRLNRSLGSAAAGPRGPFGGGRRGGARNNLSLGFHYHSSHSDLTNAFPSVGGNSTVRSFDVPVSYVRTFGKLINIARFDFNRNRIETQNLYAFLQDVAGAAGITGVSQNPFDWGIPNLQFSHFGGIQDVKPLRQRNQTLSFSDNVIWNHGKHTWRWGGDFRRIQSNRQSDSNARGTFIFTGLNTSQIVNGQPVLGTGFDLADFLLGLPQQTQVQFGENNYHFRANSWDLYVQDEWRVRGNLTLNLGVRYEYVSPFEEIDNLIANLLLSPGVLNPAQGNPSVTQVLAGENGFPDTLVRPDRNNFAPRLGFAWKPFSKTVIRGGYGINYNTGAYQTVAQQLAFQPPFSMTATNIQSASLPLTLQHGFPNISQGVISNNYAVDPDYRLGYVQIRNLNIQQEITPTLLLNIDYTGTKGTALDVLENPDRTPTGTLIPTTVAQPFNWQTSGAFSVTNAASIRVRKRLQNGFAIGGTYVFSKSIDNASSIGNGSGGTATVAQDPLNLAAERGLSSFDQRHRFTADYLWELPFGHDRLWLSNAGPLRTILGDWSWSGDWTIASGVPFTPRILGSFSDVNRGSNGTLRPDLTGLPVGVEDPSLQEWFNTAAFVAPAPGTYGNARRNSIIGPGGVVFNMALTKVFPFESNRMLEIRAQASNIFNTPQFASIDTVLNSPTFGQVISVGAMRTIQLTARFRF
jgi:hypothetical protein